MRPERLKSFAYLGRHRYFITLCTHNRARVFEDPALVDMVLDQLLFTCREQDFELTAYCIMPDHVHALVKGESDAADFQALVRLTKQRAGFRYKRLKGRSLWQDGYYEHIVRDEEGPAGFYLYIINNPARAGLVENPLDYPHWGSSVHTREEMLDATRGGTEWLP